MFDSFRERLPIILFGVLVAYLTLFYQLGSLPFFGSDEPRYAGIAEEMVQQGEFITPLLEGRPWLEKPPLVFWMQMPAFALWGVSETSARLPGVMLALLCALFTAFFAARTDTARSGVLTYFILLTNTLFFLFARAVNTDLPLTVTFTLGMGAAFIALRNESILWPLLAGAGLGLAILAKGPVAVLLFLLIFLSLAVISGRTLWSLRKIAAGTAAMLLVAAPWFILVWNEEAENFFITFILNHHLARFATDLHHHSEPFWFYFPVLLVGLFPWVFFLGSSLRGLYLRRNDLGSPLQERQLFLWLWVLVPVFFFSGGDSKLAGYVLPVVPAMAMLAAHEWDRYLNRDVATYGLMKIQLALCGAFGLVLSLVIIFGFHFTYGTLEVGIAVAAPILLSGFWARAEFRKNRLAALFTALCGGMALMAALLFWQAAPVLGDFHSARDLTVRARPLISEENPLVLYRYFHHTARYYSGYLTTRSAIDGPAELEAYLRSRGRGRVLLLTQRPGWRELRLLEESELIDSQGNLYLVAIDHPVEEQHWEALRQP